MPKLPISNPAPAHRETLYSYLGRLAGVWQADVADLANDMGVSFKRLLAQDDKALHDFAIWANLTPEATDDLLSWTGVAAGDGKVKFKDELYTVRAIRSPVMRGCPICLREDAAVSNDAATKAMVLRGDWQFREMNRCIRHGHPLVPLWSVKDRRHRFDTRARLNEIEQDILSGALDRLVTQPSPYDLWLNRRLESGIDETWLAAHSVFVVTTFCRLLGQALLERGLPHDEITSAAQNAHDLGFMLVIEGESRIRQALDEIAKTASKASDEPRKTFQPLYAQLDRDYMNEAGFDPFRDILRDCLIAHWPVAAGETVLGKALPERRVHSLRSAAQETGIGVRVLEHFLQEAGALDVDDNRPDSRKLFDARAHANLMAEIPTLVGPIAMGKAMGATRTELEALAHDGLLIPRTRCTKIKNPWRVSDGLAFLDKLAADAELVPEEDQAWETLLMARRRSGISLAELVKAILEERLTVCQRQGVFGFHGIVVPKLEIDRLSARSTGASDAVSDKVQGSTSAAEFARSIGIRSADVFQCLIKDGHVSAHLMPNPKTGRLQYQMAPEDMAAFHKNFITLTTLSAETGHHRNTLKALLASHQIAPFSPQGQDFGALYRRSDVPDGI